MCFYVGGICRLGWVADLRSATAAAKASRQAEAWLSCRRIALRLRRFAVIFACGELIMWVKLCFYVNGLSRSCSYIRYSLFLRGGKLIGWRQRRIGSALPKKLNLVNSVRLSRTFCECSLNGSARRFQRLGSASNCRRQYNCEARLRNITRRKPNITVRSTI